MRTSEHERAHHRKHRLMIMKPFDEGSSKHQQQARDGKDGERHRATCEPSMDQRRRRERNSEQDQAAMDPLMVE